MTDKKYAGVLVPVFALKSQNDFGIGDTQSLIECIDFCAQNDLSIVQLLPINETGPDNSPYNAISSQALEPAYIHMTPDAVPGLTLDILKELKVDHLNSCPDSVNYDVVKKVKVDILANAYINFKKSRSKLAKDFTSFKKEQSHWLDDFCLYRCILSLKENNTLWTDWETELQSPATAKKYLTKYIKDNDAKNVVQLNVDFWAYVQFVGYTQWIIVKNHADKLDIKLIGDLPFGVSRYSCDVWANKELFDLNWSIGAPPETYFQGDEFVRKWGQNWGMPLYNWSQHEKENFQWWENRIDSLLNFFHGYRIDHVLGFYRVYAFPWLPQLNNEFLDLTIEEAKQKTGGKIPQFLPNDDSTEKSAKSNEKHGSKILKAIKNFSKSSIIIAEDLGLVPDYVRPSLAKLGISGITIPQFERNKDYTYKSQSTYPENNLITYGTHDHDPLALFYENLVKWWHGPDGHVGWLEVQRLMDYLGWDINHPPNEFTDDLHKALLTKLFESNCKYAILIISDIFGSKQRFNQPGSNSNSNWSQRLEMTLTEFVNDPNYSQKIKFLSNLIEKTNRINANLLATK